jgi:hypothetical protein
MQIHNTGKRVWLGAILGEEVVHAYLYTGFQVACPQKSDENERMRMIALKITPKMHACVNSRRFFVDNQPENRCT